MCAGKGWGTCGCGGHGGILVTAACSEKPTFVIDDIIYAYAYAYAYAYVYVCVIGCGTRRTGLAAAARSDDVLREHRRLTQLASYIYCGPTAWRPPPPCSGGPHAWKLPSNVVKPASLNAM